MVEVAVVVVEMNEIEVLGAVGIFASSALEVVVCDLIV